MTEDEQLIEVRGLRKVFGGVAAVDDVTFDIRQGEILGLIGPNGSGKSTLINLLSGLHQPTAGEVLLEGQNITGLPPYRIARLGVARTFQLLRLFQGLSVYDNVLAAAYLQGSHGLGAAVLGRARTAAEERLLRAESERLLDFVALSGRSAVLAKTLGAGEARLLELARALATKPRLLLLDEPGAGLNTGESELLERKLRELQRLGVTQLLVDHDMQLMMRLASRVMVLNAGKVLAVGTPAEVQSNPRVVEAYLGVGHSDHLRRLKLAAQR